LLTVVGLVVLGGGILSSTKAVVAYFDASVKGVAIGGPVTFHRDLIGNVMTSASSSTRKPQYSPVFFPLGLRDRLLSAPETSGAKFAFRKDPRGRGTSSSAG